MASKHKIITFYSFKGGAGRSQLAVNLAAYLFFYTKKKVLLIDWDLEAPGLDAFFKNFEEEAKKRNSADNTFIKRFDRKTIERGLLDVLEDYVRIMQEGRKLEIEDLPFLDEKAIYSMWHDEKTGAKIDLVPAINYNREDYTHIINRFDWFDFYDRLKGNYYMETLKEKLHATDYDYIFIDSRTGLSDYSGICNIQLPDANVIVVAPTQQNLNGAKMMIDKIKSSPYTEHQRPQAVILPVLSRIDLSEENMFVEWTNKFKNSFAEDIALSLKNAGLGIEVETYINDTTLRYVKELAYGENILFNENSNGITAGSLAEKFENILGYLEVISFKEPAKNVNAYIEQLLQVENKAYEKNVVFIWAKSDFKGDFSSSTYSTEGIYFENIIIEFKKILHKYASYNHIKIQDIFIDENVSKSKRDYLYSINEFLQDADLIVLCISDKLVQSSNLSLILKILEQDFLNIKTQQILISPPILPIKQLKQYKYLSTYNDEQNQVHIFSFTNNIIKKIVNAEEISWKDVKLLIKQYIGYIIANLDKALVT